MLNRILDRIPAKKYVFAILTLFICIVIAGETTKNLAENVRTIWFFVGVGLGIGVALLVWLKTEDWLNSNDKK